MCVYLRICLVWFGSMAYQPWWPNPFLYLWTVQTREISISTQVSSIWPVDRTLSRATSPGQSGPGNNGNEGVLRIPQSSCITGAALSDCFVSYLEHSLGESYPSAEMQSVYSTAQPTYMCTCMYIYIYIYVCVCVCVCMYVWVCLYIYIYVCVCVCVCVCVRIYRSIYLYIWQWAWGDFF